MGNWDIFVDEQKNGGKIRCIGALFVEKGVTAQIEETLLKERDRVANRTKAKVGSVHWAELGDIEAQVATAWLEAYARAPLCFFVRVDAVAPDMKIHLFERLKEHLDRSDRVPGGFASANATVHLDRDRADDAATRRALRRDLGFRDAYGWDDKGSPLNQLVDLLMGIAEAEHTGHLDTSDSKAAARKKQVLEGARASFQSAANEGKRNRLILLGDAELELFV